MIEDRLTLIKQKGFMPELKFGQNFLCDEEIINNIVDLCEIGSGDRVLEIGPGLGSLSVPLSEASDSLTVVEIDKRLVSFLEDELKLKANVISSDFLKLNSYDASNIDVVDGEVSVDDFRWTLNRNALLLTDIDEEGEESDFIDMFVDAVSQDHLTLKFLGHTMDLTKVDDSEVAAYLKQSLTPVSSKRKIWTQVISIPSVENLTSARLDWSVPR